MLRRSLSALALMAALGLATFAVAQDNQQKQDPRAPEAAYPVDTCPVMNVKIDSKGTPVTRQIDGRTVKVCCARCARTFQQEPEKYHAKLDELIVAKTKDSYPLDTCVVGGEKLGSMGEAVNYVHRPTNQLVRFCCAGCTGTFKKEPAKYLAMIDEAARAKKEQEPEQQQ